MHVHCTMMLAPGKEQEVTDLLVESLPIIARYRWSLAASYRLLSGPTRTLINLWEIPDGNAFMAFGGQIAADPELARIMIGLEEAMTHNELTLVSRLLEASASRAGTEEKAGEALYVHETVTTRANQLPHVLGLLASAAPLLEKHGFRFLGSYQRASGPTRMLVNLWELPRAASDAALAEAIAADPELAKIYAAIGDLSRSVERAPMARMPYSP